MEPQELTDSRTIAFHNPDGIRFDYDLVWLGLLNHAPQVTSVPVVTAVESTGYSYTVTATDPDGHAIVGYDLLTGPEDMTISIVGETAILQWKASDVAIGTYPVAIRVSDDHGGSTTQKYVLEVVTTIPNRPPQFDTSPIVTITLGTDYLYTPSASDPDGTGVTISAETLPGWLSWNAGSMTLTGTPTGSEFGTLHPVTLKATDPTGAWVEQRYSIQVRPDPANAAPRITTDPASLLVTGGVEYRYDVDAIDRDDDTLTFSLGSDAEVGMAIDSSTGLFTWTPTVTPTASVGVTIKVADGRGGVDDQLVTLIGATNPANASISGTVFNDVNNDGIQNNGETAQPGVSVYLDLNKNGRFDSASESVSISANPTGAYQFTGLSAGDYRVVALPNLGWVATLPVAGVAQISLGDGQSATAHFGTKLAPTGQPNQNPVIHSNPPSVGAQVDTTWRYEVIASDPDGDVIEFDAPVAPNGFVIDSETGVVVWVPTANQVGDHNILIRVRDGNGGFALQSIQVSIAAPNTAPVITSNPKFAAMVGIAYEYAVKAQDADGDTLTYSLVGNEPGSMSIDSTTGFLTWNFPTPEGNQFDIVVRVEDGKGASFEQSYTLNVVAQQTNQTPEFTSSPRLTITSGQTYYYQASANDADGDALTYALTPGQYPAGMTIDPMTGLVTWVTDADDVGTHSVRIEVTDGRSSAVEQSYVLAVNAGAQVNHPPMITSSPTLQARVDQPYLYNLTATDPDGDPVQFFLTQAPAGVSLDADTGALRWTPALYQAGNKRIELVAVDAYGATDAQGFWIEVRDTNLPPSFVGNPNTQGVAGEVYATPLQAIDPDGDTLTFALVSYPQGMTINPQTGLVRWPISSGTSAQQVPVTVSVTDGRETVSRSFTIDVTATPINRPPVITSFAPGGLVVVGSQYQYEMAAFDPDNDALQYRIAAGSQSGMTFDADGRFTWTPTVAGSYTFYLEAVEQPGTAGKLSAYEKVTLNVRANTAPYTIPPAPPTEIVQGLTFRHDVRAKDNENDAISFKATGSAAGLTIDNYGRVSWDTTALTPGSHSWDLILTDAYGTENSYTYSLTVLADTMAPSVTVDGRPNPTEVGSNVTIRINASDNVGIASRKLEVSTDQSNWQTVSIDATGAGVFTPTSAGKLYLRATATDPAGLSSTVTSYVRIVTANDTTPPIAQITGPANGSTVTATMTITGKVDDPEDNLIDWKLEYKPTYAGTWLLVNEADIEVNGTLGTIDVTALSDGKYDLRLTARDAQYTSTSTSQFRVDGNTAFIIDPTDSTPPIVRLNSPTTGTTVTKLSEIIGIVDDPDDNLVQWTLESRREGTDVWQTIVTGSKEYTTASALGLLDPTSLANDEYQLRLRALDAGGQEASTSIRVTIDSTRLKLGNMQLSAVDLTIPVGGIPITVGRSYDSHDADTVGDFGYGWSLELGGYETEVDDSTTDYQGNFLHDTRVSILGADGSRYSFRFQPRQSGWLSPTYIPQFVSEDPWAPMTLEVVSNQELYLAKTSDSRYLVYGSSLDLNPNSTQLPLSYVVTDRVSGLETTLSARSDETVAIIDRNGNELSFERYSDGTPIAIVHGHRDDQQNFTPSGRSVSFELDPSNNRRIAAVVDPRGNKVRYNYDAQGNLASVIDRVGVTMVEYGYRTDPAHYLETVTDALGTRVLEAKYDPVSKRLSELKDAEGNPATFGYALTDPSDTTSAERATQTVTIPNAGSDGTPATSMVAFNERGNPLRSVDPVGSESMVEYGNPTLVDHPTKTVQVVGLPDDPQNGETDDLVTLVQYDSKTGLPIADDRPLRRHHPAPTYNNLHLPETVGQRSAGQHVPIAELPRHEGNLTSTPVPPKAGLPPVSTTMTKGNLLKSVSRAGATSSMNYDPVRPSD